MITCYVLLYIVKNNKILLLRRAPGATYNRGGYYGLPGGGIEAGETFKQAAIREAYEELGIKIKSEDLEFANVAHKTLNLADGNKKAFVTVTFIVNNWKGEVYNKEPHQHDLMGWYALNDKPQPFFAAQEHLFSDIPNKKLYSEITVNLK